MPDAGDYAYLWAWEPIRPHEVLEFLSSFAAPWWICGGWALDLFLDRETRRHDDLDVAVLRRDQFALYEHLRTWDLHYATPDHTLERWDGQHLELPIHGIWARRSDKPAAPWACELLLNETQDGEWVFRQNESVRCPLEEVGNERDGLPFLRPEIVLLYKSMEPSPKNDADFAAVAQDLSPEGSLWLRTALETCAEQHPWIGRLS
jgi:hypothetical protein